MLSLGLGPYRIMSWISIGLAIGTIVFLIAYVQHRTAQKLEEAKHKFGPNTEICGPRDYMWKMEGETNKTIINGVLFAEEVTAEEIQKVFMKTFGQDHYRKFRQRLIVYKRVPMWIDDRTFDPKWHFSCEENPLTKPTTDEELNDWLAHECSAAINIDRPLWTLRMVENFKKNANGKYETVLLFRCHHVIADGIALGTMLFNILNNEEEAEILKSGKTLEEDPTLRLDESSSQTTKKTAPNPWLVNMYCALSFLPIMVKLLFQNTDRNLFKTDSTEGKKSIAMSKTFPLEKVKMIKSKLGMTVNDVLMGVLGCAIHRASKKLNSSLPPPDFVKCVMPINMRTYSTIPLMENDLALPILELPTCSDNPLVAAKRMQLIIDTLKKSLVPLVVYNATIVMGYIMPSSIVCILLDFLASKHTLVCSNVPGPVNHMYIGVNKVSRMIFWVPQRAACGMGFSIMSMANNINVGCIMDSSVGNHSQLICDEYMQALVDLETMVLKN
eukprot:CFRG7239T1